jgi:arylsulfatase A-like enzyme
MLGEKQAWRKFKLWERAARVPFIIALPSSSSAGRACDRPVSLLDLYPTLTALCLDEVPPVLDGRSLVPMLRDPAADWPHAAITSYFDLAGGTRATFHAVRTGRWRFIRYPDGGEELYDHADDPHEWRNLLPPGQVRAANLEVVRDELARLLPNTSRPGDHDS